MSNNQQGFTLIELVVVIVILGILAATAIPKFIDLSDDAQTAAINGTAGGLSSASSINYGGCLAVGQAVTANKCIKTSKCSDVGALLIPTLTLGTTASATVYYLLADTAQATNGNVTTCTIQKDLGTTSPKWTATYSFIAAGN